MRTSLFLLSTALAGGCAAPCGEVGRAIADRTLDCEGSSSMGVGRARALQFTYECPREQGWYDPFTMPRACAEAILDLDCDELRDNGDDLEKWLAAHPSCDKLEYVGPPAVGTGVEPTTPEPTPTDTGLTLDELPCSDGLGDPTDLTIRNDSGVAVDVFWRDEGCGMTLYWTLAPDESYVQSTLTRHVWVARELTGARELVDWTTAAVTPADSWSITR